MHRFWTSIIRPALDALRPRVVVEIGSREGHLTRPLLEWCAGNEAVAHVIDPLPPQDLEAWQQEFGEVLVFHRELSLTALPRVHDAGAVLIDGDHNWYTVFNELSLLAGQAEGREERFPLVFLHDLEWPYGRRDLYYEPDTIPEGHRRPAQRLGLRPDEPGLSAGAGINAGFFNAVREDGERNGVLTAVEDFMEETDLSLTLTRVSGFHGLGVLISEGRLRANPEVSLVIESIRPSEALELHLKATERARIDERLAVESLREELRTVRSRLRAQVKKSSALSEKNTALRRTNISMTEKNAELAGRNSELSRLNERLARESRAIRGSAWYRVGRAVARRLR